MLGGGRHTNIIHVQSSFSLGYANFTNKIIPFFIFINVLDRVFSKMFCLEITFFVTSIASLSQRAFRSLASYCQGPLWRLIEIKSSIHQERGRMRHCDHTYITKYVKLLHLCAIYITNWLIYLARLFAREPQWDSIEAAAKSPHQSGHLQEWLSISSSSHQPTIQPNMSFSSTTSIPPSPVRILLKAWLSSSPNKPQHQ